MNTAFRCFAGVLGFAAIIALAAPQSTQGQAKKDKKAVKVMPVVEATAKTSKDWLLRETKIGLKMVSDKEYYITALPKELTGSNYLMRTSADHAHWLPPATVKAKQDVTAFAMIRVQYNGKELFGETDAAKLEKDGWKLVEGNAATSFPGKENWKWAVFKKPVKEGEVILDLDNLKWPGTAVLFFFK